MMDCSEQGGAVIPIIRRSSGAAYRFCRAAAPGAWRSWPAAGLLARSRWLESGEPAPDALEDFDAASLAGLDGPAEALRRGAALPADRARDELGCAACRRV